MANKKRKCLFCKEYQLAESGVRHNVGFFCNNDHAYKYAIKKTKAANDRRFRKEIRDGREKLKTKSDYLKTAQTAFNAFIRERDKGLPCISCGTRKDGIQYHAGHFKSVGAAGELRFNERNCHKQCATCNNHLSGNLLEYRKGLINRYGLEVVDYLESLHSIKHYTVEQIKEITLLYRAKLRQLKKL